MKIYSIHYNKPEYIHLQKKSLEAKCKIVFEFIIVNNSSDDRNKKEINSEAQRLGIRTIDSQNSTRSNPSVSHNNAFKYILNDMNNGEVVMILDHDIFLINTLDIEYFDKYDLVMLPQKRGNVEYPWPGMIIFNKVRNKDQISFDPGVIENEMCDTGGNMYYYIRNNNLNIRRANENHIGDKGNVMSNIDDLFIHVISGSGWNPDHNLDWKINHLRENILKDIN